MVNQQLAIYIPYIHQAQATAEYIANIFHRLNIAYVKHIEFQPLVCGGFNAFVFMNYWYNNSMVERLQERIMGDEGGGRLVYDDPLAWTIYPTQRSEYLAEINKLKVINQSLIEQISRTTTQFEEMKKMIGEAQWWIKHHDMNIRYLLTDNQCDTIATKLASNNENIVDNSYINNSCCGAVSDAWKPSNSSISAIWAKRLRSR